MYSLALIFGTIIPNSRHDQLLSPSRPVTEVNIDNADMEASEDDDGGSIEDIVMEEHEDATFDYHSNLMRVSKYSKEKWIYLRC